MDVYSCAGFRVWLRVETIFLVACVVLRLRDAAELVSNIPYLLFGLLDLHILNVVDDPTSRLI